MRWPLHRRKIGLRGELIAARYLWRKGFRLLEQNFRCDLGEIDLIAEDRGTVVFVEVKTRRTRSSGAPEESVDHHKQQQIRRVANWYLRAWPRWPRRIRFDVVGIELDDDDRLVAIRHIPGAFEAQ